MKEAEQAEIDRANSQFWNELCGTGLATVLGIKDHSLESLRRFDQAYFDIYPYLLPIVQPERMRGRRVLEIGLGFGSLGHKLAESGAIYSGLDIAPKAAEMTNHRLRLVGLPGRAVCGSALEMPFADASFDFVVSIGCFHHTGDVQRCFDETYRVLAPGGSAVLMVYNKFSYRQWMRWPWRTFRAGLQQLLFGSRKQRLLDEQRKAYDQNAQGMGAPETILLSMRDLRRMLSRFEGVRLQKQNCDPLFFFGRLVATREKLLTSLGRRLGLDIYFEARKPLEVVAAPGARKAA
jgi:SAM-dependent methyltransferase